MSTRYEIRFSGAGGQGLITAGIILAEAASIVEDQHAVQSQSYGPEARGGASKSEVIISDGPIDYPKATMVDACLALTQEAADRYADTIKPGGLLLLDADFVKNPPAGDFKIYRFPIINTAKTDIGRARRHGRPDRHRQARVGRRSGAAPGSRSFYGSQQKSLQRRL
jgi:2-oxoglutarate ferredoxin oxidoreductase subunit gamma